MTGTVVITGVGRRGQLGEAVADAFAARGARLRLLDRDAGELAARVAEQRARGVDCIGFPCDLTSATAVAAVAEQVAAEGHGVAALACLAGGFAASGPLAESELAVWDRMWALNGTTAWCTTHAFLPLLREARGAIAYVASAAVLPGGRVANLSAYAASKAALLALMQAVAQEEKETGVRANAVAPTSIRTAANEATMGTDVAYVDREVVAGWIAHLCSPAASNMTGQVIRLA
ncbi:MAG: SDR family NAD(P)-dependent oxidoreductase [Gemmatimonadetes bacterium]|nr:SDR family NAD(P)-dependent oxidoreductase [Gemmatimonadota bacterium]